MVLALTGLFPTVSVVVRASSQPAPVASSVNLGIIASMCPSTHDIHLISPDGTGDQVLWTASRPPGPWGTLDLAWRPDGRELTFSSDHEETCSWYQSDVYAIGFDGGGYRRVANSPACAVLASLPKGPVTAARASSASRPMASKSSSSAPSTHSVRRAACG